MNTSKWVTVALSLGVLASTTACGNASGNGNQKVTLTFWQAQDQLPTGVKKSDWWMTKAINEYEKQHPNVTINYVQLTTGQAYDAKIKAVGVAQNGPDVATMFAGGQTLSNSKFLEPLDSYLSPDFIKTLSGWETVRENYTSNGKIYGVPFGAGYYYFVYYNKALFKKAGINPNGPMPKTWNDLLADATKLKSAGITPFEIGEKEGYFGAWVIDAWLSAQVGTQGIFDMYHNKLAMNDSSMVKSYQAWRDLYAKGYTNPDAPSLDNGAAEQNFIQGKGAMLMTGMWVNSDLYNGMKNNVSLFPVSPLNGSRYMDSLSGGPNNDYVIFKSSKHKQQAIDFIKFLASAKIQDTRVAGQQAEPSNAKGADLSVIKNPLLHEEAQYISQSKNLGYPFDNVMAQQLDDYWYRTNSQVFAGKMDPQSAAGSIEQEYKQEKP